jgi:hypothetical protein
MSIIFNRNVSKVMNEFMKGQNSEWKIVDFDNFLRGNEF